MRNMSKAVIAMFLCLAFLLVGCDDLLDKQPLSSLSPNSFWKSKSDANAWMVGVYDAMQSALKSNYAHWGEGRSDNFRSPGFSVGSTTIIYANSLSAGDGNLSSIVDWSQLYVTIARCNEGIENLTKMYDANIEGASAVYKDYIGQCYGIRALSYYYAMRSWGRVPIVLSSINSSSQNFYYRRESIDSVKKVIQSDIENCILNISTVNRKYNFSIGAAYALKADVHSWFKEYNEALLAIESLEKLNYYTWITNKDAWKLIFTQPESSSETIFHLFYDYIQDNGGSGVAGLFGSSSSTSQWTIVPEIFDTLYNRKTDARRWMCFDTLTFSTPAVYKSTNLNSVKCGKYYTWDSNQARPNQSITGGFVYEASNFCSAKIPIYRFADVQLMKAEIYCKKGEYQKSLDIVNKIRSRVGYSVQLKLANYSNPMEQIFDDIMNERRIELFAEGKRWFDLLRVSNANYDYFHKVMDPVMNNRKQEENYRFAVPFTGVDEGRILLPIISTAFNANPNLQGDQNPPYSE